MELVLVYYENSTYAELRDVHFSEVEFIAALAKHTACAIKDRMKVTERVLQDFDIDEDVLQEIKYLISATAYKTICSKMLKLYQDKVDTRRNAAVDAHEEWETAKEAYTQLKNGI